MDQYHTPDESQVAKLLAADAQAPVAAPQFQAASRHRKATLANHMMLHLDGTPFTSTS